MSAPQQKTFGKSTREVPSAAQKASKWYPAEDEAQHKKVCVNYARERVAGTNYALFELHDL